MHVTVIWAAIIALGVFMYLVLDGYDLGIGIVLPFFPDEHERDLIMNNVAPVWDGNEAWLLLGGAALFAAFPVVYSTVLSTLYLPLAFVLGCLVLRGVAFGRRAKNDPMKKQWDLAFIAGSAGAAFFQGVALGAFLQGMPIESHLNADHAMRWLTPFSVLSGLGLVATYALLGTCWLVARTWGDLQRRLHRLVWPLTMGLLGFIVLVSVWRPLQDVTIAARWFDVRLFARLVPVPPLVLACAYWMHRAMRARRRTTPFLAALSLVSLAYLGLFASLWPYAIPQSVTLWQAAAPRSSHLSTLACAAIVLPLILAYTAMSHRLFRSRIRTVGTHPYR
ncbi:cytochrome d ubiquinol oxidase subunit II [Paraburkholderia sp.]|uniref:cytochrome d ubiquinol oxidase subunit II n=1 Tax=Paraburkholderia sp. TaxID=1926495 RepID=UPI0025CC2556|nr:cytochrome d ubiquinol oxidase subunit II [Paraburkholderia sp.]